MVQEVTGRPKARLRRRACYSELSHLGHVDGSLVGVNELHLELEAHCKVCKLSTILSAANMNASKLDCCDPLAWCQWWDEPERSVHAATVWWLTRKYMPVQRCNSRASWAWVTLSDASWLLYQQSNGFDAVTSTERSNCWQLDLCVASLTAQHKGRRWDLIHSWLAG